MYDLNGDFHSSLNMTQIPHVHFFKNNQLHNFFPRDEVKWAVFYFHPIVRFNILIAGDGFRIPLRRDVLRNYVTIH